MAEEIITNNTITIEGRKLLVNSLVNGIGLEFVHFGIGDGETPEAPENLTALVNPLFEVAVSKTAASQTEQGVTLVRGSFTNSNERGDFYWRELGIFARAAGTQETPVLFGYLNYGAQANYIPSVGIKSIIQQGIILQIVTGSAKVIYLSDPTAPATLQDIEDCINTVEEKLNVFSQDSLDDLSQQISTLQSDIDEAINKLEQVSEGHVLRSGDTMTGDLNMGGNKIVGNLQGSASQWNGWRAFDTLEELNDHAGTELTTESSEIDIINAMPTKSRFIRVTTDSSPFRVNGQQVWGMLEILKPADYFCELLISGSAGQRFRCSWDTTVGLTPWVSEIGTPAGIIDTFAGAAAPLGYLLCHGQSVSTAAYPALFNAIGYTYGGSGGSFNVPDMRGVFLRGLDAGRGVDSGRKLGSIQQSGAPNITGEFGGQEPTSRTPCNGAFTTTQRKSGVVEYDGGVMSGYYLEFDASRVSNQYQNGLTEVRPVNIAVNYIIKY